MYIFLTPKRCSMPPRARMFFFSVPVSPAPENVFYITTYSIRSVHKVKKPECCLCSVFSQDSSLKLSSTTYSHSSACKIL